MLLSLCFILNLDSLKPPRKRWYQKLIYYNFYKWQQINGLHDTYFWRVLAILIIGLLVAIFSRLLSLPKYWKLVLHCTLYYSHSVSVILKMVFKVMLCSFSFGSVVPCFICCSIYLFVFDVLLLSLSVTSFIFNALSLWKRLYMYYWWHITKLSNS